MNRRKFVQVLLGSSALSTYAARALMLEGNGDLLMAIYPGTAAQSIDSGLFSDYTRPLNVAMAAKVGHKVYVEYYRSFSLIKNVIENNRADVLLVPPTLAVRAMQAEYEPVVRVKDFITGMVIKRKGEIVKRIAMTPADTWPGLMGRQLLAERKLGSIVTVDTVGTQDVVKYLLEQKTVQAGVMITPNAKAMLATGQYEVWYPLNSTPGFTVLLHNKLMGKYAESIRQTMLSLSAPAINGLQTLIPAPIKQFVLCNRQDYELLEKTVAAK